MTEEGKKILEMQQRILEIMNKIVEVQNLMMTPVWVVPTNSGIKFEDLK